MALLRRRRQSARHSYRVRRPTNGHLSTGPSCRTPFTGFLAEPRLPPPFQPADALDSENARERACHGAASSIARCRASPVLKHGPNTASGGKGRKRP